MIDKDHPPTPGSIVVGVDASGQARHALSVALDLARRLNVGCHVVHTWHYPAMAMGSPVYVPPVALEDLSPRHRLWLDELLANVPTSGVVVTREVRQGLAGDALVQAAADARAVLLVVGSVGHGAIVGTLLGSVSQYCVHHAVCPVVVVPPPDRVAPARRPGTARVSTPA